MVKSLAQLNCGGGGTGALIQNKVYIANWRKTRGGDLKVVDGKRRYWCPCHKLTCIYDGLCVIE